ncbi:MAG: cadmium-translocating P-type ATPase [Candidatus Heimdallarchaeota archaeon]|nr:cadmium-translocating P-type ATPase [Candidatus Heimdallarchaeota archaeon]
MTQQLSVSSAVSCSCSDDCGTNKIVERQVNMRRMILSMVLKNDRMQYMLYTIVVVIIGVILQNTLGEGQYVRIIWIIASVLGLIIPGKNALKSLKKKTLTINTLLVVSTVSALIVGLYEEAIILVLIFSLGEIIESVMVQLTDRELDGIKSLVPAQASKVLDDGNTVTIATKEIKSGDLLLLRSGDIIPIDAEIVDGIVDIQQSHLTGENTLKVAKIGDHVFAGAIVSTGSCTIKATVDAGNTEVDFIIRSVEEALQNKSSAERFSQKFGKVYTPFTFVFAMLVVLIMPLFSHDFEFWMMRALVILVVSCSCGLALSVPITMVTTIASGAKHRILIRGGGTVEKLHGIDAVIFDKTGTLTHGRPKVIAVKLDEQVLYDQIYALARLSNHPISQAIVKHFNSEFSVKVNEFKEEAGKGISGVIEGRIIQLVKDVSFEYKDEVIREYGNTVTYSLIKVDELVKGYIIVEDSLRDEAVEAIQTLKEMGLSTYLISGDQKEVSAHIANKLGIDEYHAEILPLQKAELLQNLRSKHQGIAMIGDGINDTPAFSHADVSFAMGHSGTQIASDIADVVLLEDDLSHIAKALKHGKRAFKNVQLNMVMALSTISLLLILAFTGVIDLVSGIILNEVTALLIIANGLRMLKFEEFSHS